MDLSRLPEDVRKMIGNAASTQIATGRSKNHVFRVENSTGVRFLKVSSQNGSAEIQREHRVLDWLSVLAFPFSPVPLYCHSSLSFDVLLMSSIAGANLDTRRRVTSEMAFECARVLRDVHRLPVEACPFDQRLSVKIPSARKLVEAGLVDESDFDSERQGRSAPSVLDEIFARKPKNEDVVFTHGDFSPANVLFTGPGVSGLVDWGRAGLADRYQDLALFCRSLENTELINGFLSAYGIEDVDQEKLEFYVLLDELF